MQTGLPQKQSLNEPGPASENQRNQSGGLPEKPVTTYRRPDLTRLPRLTIWRRIFRWFMKGLTSLAVTLFTHCQVNGMSNFPLYGPALIVTNHLGDADPVLAAALFPSQVEGFAKIDLVRDYPPIGWVMDMYGVIWVHRGQPDRRALRAGLQALKEGRIVAIAPEGRESLSGSLEPGMDGAAFLALKTGVPVVPLVFIGTENSRIFGGMKRMQRSSVSIRVGPAFRLGMPEPARREVGGEEFYGGKAAGNHASDMRALPDRAALDQGTRTIMLALAELLPAEYRGVYQKGLE